MALLEVNELTKNYLRRAGWWGASQEKCVVDRVSFAINRGETLGLVGESGSGKSTVARMVLGLIPPSSGNVSFDNQAVSSDSSSASLRTLRRRMQPVFQDPFAALNPRMTVAEIIAEPFRIHHQDASQDTLHDLLGQVGLGRGAQGRIDRIERKGPAGGEVEGDDTVVLHHDAVDGRLDHRDAGLRQSISIRL